MDNIVAKATDFLITQNAIKREDAAIYRYGMEMMLLSLAEVASILLLAMVVGNFSATFLYFMAFMLLRLFAGGYHATTRLRCYLLSLGAYGAFSLCLLVAPISFYGTLSLAMAVLSTVVVFAYAPIVHHNRKTNKATVHHCKNISRKIACTELLLIILGCLFYPGVAIFAFTLGFFGVVCSMLVVKAKR